MGLVTYSMIIVGVSGLSIGIVTIIKERKKKIK
ncbi:hypothetical protein QF041_003509 [Paenibacillus sp. W2I17]|nr:hypothetical protein [Paenibacillus sp. W2I17]